MFPGTLGFLVFLLRYLIKDLPILKDEVRELRQDFGVLVSGEDRKPDADKIERPLEHQQRTTYRACSSARRRLRPRRF